MKSITYQANVIHFYTINTIRKTKRIIQIFNVSLDQLQSNILKILLIDHHNFSFFTYILNHIDQINNISSQRNTFLYNQYNQKNKTHNTNIRC